MFAIKNLFSFMGNNVEKLFQPVPEIGVLIHAAFLGVVNGFLALLALFRIVLESLDGNR